jgi:hypothetical protein
MGLTFRPVVADQVAPASSLEAFGGNQGVVGSGQSVVCARNGAPPWWQVAATAQPVVTDGERLYLAQTDQVRVIDARAQRRDVGVSGGSLATRRWHKLAR